MADGSHFVKKNQKKRKFRLDLNMARNAIKCEFRTSKVADASHFVKISKNIKVAYRSEMARNAFKREFRTSNMGEI